MPQSINPFLMFTGRAEEAMNYYLSIFPGGSITSIERWRDGEPGRVGSVKRAAFVIAGRVLECSDTPVEHAFTFTPSLSLFVECDDESEQTRAFERRSDGGQVLMPLGDYGFSKRFGWVNDRFGVSWQLNLRA